MYDIYNINWCNYFWKHCKNKTNQNLKDYLSICKWYAIRNYKNVESLALEYIEIT